MSRYKANAIGTNFRFTHKQCKSKTGTSCFEKKTHKKNRRVTVLFREKLPLDQGL